MEIISIKIPNDFYFDETGRKGWQNVNVYINVLYENEIFEINFTDIVRLHEYNKFSIEEYCRQYLPNYIYEVDNPLYKSYEISHDFFYKYLLEVYNEKEILSYENNFIYFINDIKNYGGKYWSKESIKNKIKELKKYLKYLK